MATYSDWIQMIKSPTVEINELLMYLCVFLLLYVIHVLLSLMIVLLFSVIFHLKGSCIQTVTQSQMFPLYTLSCQQRRTLTGYVK